MLDYEAPETAEEDDAPAAAAAVGGAAAAAPPQLEVAAAAVGDVYCGHRDASLLKWMRTEIPHVLVVYVPDGEKPAHRPLLTSRTCWSAWGERGASNVATSGGKDKRQSTGTPCSWATSCSSTPRL